MKTLNIFTIELKKFLMDFKIYLFVLIIAPLIISIINGIIYKNSFSVETKMKKFDIAIVDKDSAALSKPIFEIFNSDKIRKIVNTFEVHDLKAAKDKLKSGTYSAVIVIPDNFTERASKGDKTSIDVLQADNSSLNTEFIYNIVSSYTEKLNSKALYSDPKTSKILSQNYISVSKAKKNNTLTSTQYYSISMLVLSTLFISAFGISEIYKDRESDVILRLKAASTSKLNFIFGKLIGIFVLSFIQICIFIILSFYVNKINWTEHFLSLLLLSVVHAFLVTSFTAFICGITKTRKTALTLSMFIIGIMSFFGGTFWNINAAYGSFIKIVSHSTLNYWLQTSYSSILLGSSNAFYLKNISILTVIALAFMVIGTILFKYEKSEVI